MRQKREESREKEREREKQRRRKKNTTIENGTRRLARGDRAWQGRVSPYREGCKPSAVIRALYINRLFLQRANVRVRVCASACLPV